MQHQRHAPSFFNYILYLSLRFPTNKASNMTKQHLNTLPHQGDRFR
jgi:hypothetical protein